MLTQDSGAKVASQRLPVRLTFSFRLARPLASPSALAEPMLMLPPGAPKGAVLAPNAGAVTPPNAGLGVELLKPLANALPAGALPKAPLFSGAALKEKPWAGLLAACVAVAAGWEPMAKVGAGLLLFCAPKTGC